MYIDCDTHFFPKECLREVARLADSPKISAQDGMEVARINDRVVTAYRDDGYRNPETRIQALKKSRFDRQVLIGDNRFLPDYISPQTSVALAAAYNDSVAGISRKYESLVGVAQVSTLDGTAATRELLRAVRDLGLRAVRLLPNLGGRNLDAPEWLPFYAMAEKLGVAILVHANAFEAPGVVTRNLVSPERLATHQLPAALGFPMEYSLAVASLIFSAILEKHPTLRFAFFEAGAGFTPYLMDRLDEHYEHLHEDRHLRTGIHQHDYIPRISMKPSRFFRQLYFATEPDEEELPHAIERCGDTRLVIGSDFPHPEGTLPHTIPQLKKRDDVSNTSKERIMGANAEKLLFR